MEAGDLHASCMSGSGWPPPSGDRVATAGSLLGPRRLDGTSIPTRPLVRIDGLSRPSPPKPPMRLGSRILDLRSRTARCGEASAGRVLSHSKEYPATDRGKGSWRLVPGCESR